MVGIAYDIVEDFVFEGFSRVPFKGSWGGFESVDRAIGTRDSTCKLGEEMMSEYSISHVFS